VWFNIVTIESSGIPSIESSGTGAGATPGVLVMSKAFATIAARAWDCARAAEAEAGVAVTPSLRNEYETLAKRWQILATRFEYVARLEAFPKNRPSESTAEQFASPRAAEAGD
jgi:hypothetical protein